MFNVTPARKKLSWKAGVNFQPSDPVLYASAATGYSLPGYNTRPLQFTQVEQSGANEDVAYEIGTKLDLMDRRVRLNIAAFYTDFKNRPTTIAGAEALLNDAGQPQVGNQQLESLPGGPAGSTRCSTTTVPANTGIVCPGRTYFRNQPATVRGIEAEYTVSLIENLLVSGSVGWSKFWAPDIAARTVNRRQWQSVLDGQQRRAVQDPRRSVRGIPHAAHRLDLREQPDRQRHLDQVQQPDVHPQPVQHPRHL